MPVLLAVNFHFQPIISVENGRVRKLSEKSGKLGGLTGAGLVLSMACLPTVAAADEPGPLVASHRGSISQAPENTLAAFRWALSAGADLIEADLRVTRDGHLVVIHDKSVERTTNGQGRVRDLDLADLKSLDAGQGEVIPTLDETLAFVSENETSLLLDVKDSLHVDPSLLVSAIEHHGIRDRVVVGSRSIDLVRSLKILTPELKMIAMVPEPAEIDSYLELEVDAVRLWARWLRSDPELVERIRAAGAEIWVTAGGLKGRNLRRALEVADGVITNHPAEARAITLARR